MGVLYQYGGQKGIVTDFREAVKWYGKAADQGHEQAKEYLAEMRATYPLHLNNCDIPS